MRKSPMFSPLAGNCIANSKGVHCEVESEKKLAANIWPNVQKLHIRHLTMDEIARTNQSPIAIRNGWSADAIVVEFSITLHEGQNL